MARAERAHAIPVACAGRLARAGFRPRGLAFAGLLAGAAVVAGALLPAGAVAAGARDDTVHRHEPPVVLAPGYSDLAFEAPAPGSYRLPALGAAADGEVLDVTGATRSLHELFGDRLVVLGFIYTRCADVNGCPLVAHVFGRVADALRESSLKDRVRLVSLSFDPAGDPPAAMARYARPHERPGVDWRFLTTAGQQALAPILDAYDQWVIREVNERGEPLGTLSHVLRVYLIDRERRIRNIYSVSFLHPETILNDVRTVLLEEKSAAGGDGGR